MLVINVNTFPNISNIDIASSAKLKKINKRFIDPYGCIDILFSEEAQTIDLNITYVLEYLAKEGRQLHPG